LENNLHILIVEDELSFAIDLEMILREMGFERLYLRDTYEAGMSVLENVPINLALLDIHINGRNRGIDLAKRTNELNIPTIFISAFTDETVFQQAELAAPMAYLNKPVQALTLRSLIQTVVSQQNAPVKPFHKDLFIKNGRHAERIPLEQIDFIESDGNYCTIQTEKKRFALKMTLKKMLEELPETDFIQVHKSWVVRIAKIGQLDNARELILVGTKEIPVGRTFKPALLDQLLRR
jgi:DNA-binding LytR/AlgR family response regulator